MPPRNQSQRSARFRAAAAVFAAAAVATLLAAPAGEAANGVTPGARASAAGLLNPFPIVQVDGRVAKGGTKLRRLIVTAPEGSTVAIECRGRGCPLRQKSYVAPTVRLDRLENRLLYVGVVIEISITKPGTVGKYLRLEVRRGKAPMRTDSCLMPGNPNPGACPSSSGAAVDVADNSVTTAKLADGAVSAAKIAADAVGAAQIQTGAITSGELLDGAVQSADILDGTIAIGDIAQSVWSGNVNASGTLAARPPANPANDGFLYFATDVDGGTLYRSNGATWVQVATGAAGASVADGSISEAKLADNAVTSVKIAADTVAAADIAAGAVASAEIFDSTVASADIAADTILAGDVAANAVGSAEIAADAVTADEILDSTVGSGDIAADTITAADIATDGVGATEITADAVGASEIAANAVTTAEILDATIASADIALDTITAADIATDAVGAAEILADAVGTSEIAADAVTATEIATDAVGSAEIGTNAVGSVEIATGAVTTSEILDSTVTGTDIADDTIQTADLAPGAAGESTYRLVETRAGKLDQNGSAGTHVLPVGGTVGGSSIPMEGTDVQRDLGVFYLSSADYAITGRTTELRIRATLLANGIPPGTTVKVGLYPVTANGGANDRNNVTLGSVVAEATISSISANTHRVATSSTFSFPADGFYALGVNLGANQANNSLIDLTADLQVHNL